MPIPRLVRPRRPALLTLCLAALATLGSVPALATSPVAVTGDATSVSPTSETLHGVVNASNSDSAWTFQYRTASSSAWKTTGTSAAGAGLRAVSTTISHLRPNTAYVYRLVVEQGSYQPTYSAGQTRSFTTAAVPSFGKLSFPSRSLTVSGGVVSIPIACSGPRGGACAGKLTLLARPNKRSKPLVCAGRPFSATAPANKVLRIRLSNPCRALLRNARGHRLAALLRASFSTRQHPLAVTVKLRAT